MLIHLGVFWIPLSNFWLYSFLYVWKTYVFSHAVTFGFLLLIWSLNRHWRLLHPCMKMQTLETLKLSGIRGVWVWQTMLKKVINRGKLLERREDMGNVPFLSFSKVTAAYHNTIDAWNISICMLILSKVAKRPMRWQ